MSEPTMQRQVGSGVPLLPWKVSRHADYIAEYEGHAFVTTDPKGLARSVCEGFWDDMEWIVSLHNKVIAQTWRARLARWLLGVTIRDREQS